MRNLTIGCVAALVVTQAVGTTVAEDANADIPLTLEFVEDLQGDKVDTALSTATCVAPFDLNLESLMVDATVVCVALTLVTVIVSTASL